MTIAAAHPRIVQYPGAGQAGPFVVDFRFLDAADLIVELRAADGSLAVLTGWSAAGAGEPDGGTVTLAQPAPTGSILTIRSRVARIQPADYIAADAFPAETHEAALDRLTLIAQDQDRDLARTLAAPHGETLTPLPTAAARAGGILAFDEAGQPDTSRDYNTLVADIAQTVAPAAVTMIAEAGAEAAAAIEEAGNNQRQAVLAEGVAQASSLGMVGALRDIITAAAGFDTGHVTTDPDGYTTDDFWHVRITGVNGNVLRDKIPGADFSGLEGAYRVWEIPPPPEWPYTPLMVFHAGDLNEDANFIPNVADPENPSTYSGNFYPWPQADLRNQGSTSNPTVATASDPDWIELTWTSSSASFQLSNANVNKPAALPDGDYVVEFEYRRRAEDSDQAFRYGSASSPSDRDSFTATATAQTGTFTFTVSGGNYITHGFYGDGSNSPRIWVRKLRYYPAADLPGVYGEDRVWALVKLTGYHNSFLTNENGSLDLTTGRGTNTGGWAILVNDAVVTFNEITIAVAIEPDLPSSGTQTIVTTEANTALSTATSTQQLGIDSNGAIRASPLVAGASQIRAAGVGPLIIGLTAKNNDQAIKWNELNNYWKNQAFTPFSARVFRLFGHSTSSQIGGKLLGLHIQNHAASQDEWEEVCARMRYEVLQRTGVDMTTFLPDEVAIWSGDSRSWAGGTIGSTLAYSRQLGGLNEFGSSNKTLPVLLAASSSDTIAMQRTVLTENNTSEAFPFGPGGVARMFQAIRAAMGKRALSCWGPMTVNNGAHIIANPLGWLADELIPTWEQARDLVQGNHNLLVSTETIANPAVNEAFAGWEAARLVLNEGIRDWVSDNPGVTLADIGATPELGDPGNASDPNVLDDEYHWSGLAHTSVAKPLYKAALVSMGV